MWLTICIIGLLTLAIRLSFILMWGVIEVPPLLRRALRFVPAAALSAIILPEVLMRDGAVSLSIHNGRLLAGLVAMAVAWRTSNVLLTIALGMGVLWLVGG